MDFCAACLPAFVTETLRSAIPQLNNKLPGFSSPAAILTALESRSSPLRILRDPNTLQSPAIAGLYPVGEGSGYSGGIMSSATDALKTAEAIAANP